MISWERIQWKIGKVGGEFLDTRILLKGVFNFDYFVSSEKQEIP
jgi:hypothetical protein